MRLIDADALFINLDGMMAVSPTGYIHGDTVADMISDAPTVEAVPVIRCKDCKHWQYESCFVDSEEGDAESIISDRFAFDFCSRAEVREE